MTGDERPAVLRARLEPMSVEAFEATVWCADCNPTVHTASSTTSASSTSGTNQPARRIGR